MGSSFSVPVVYEVGRNALNFVGNGYSLTSHSMIELAAYANMIRGRRRRILGEGGSAPEFVQSTPLGSPDALRFRGGFRTSPDSGVIGAYVVGLPADSNTTAVKPRGRFQFQKISDLSLVSQPYQHLGKRKTTSLGASDMFWLTQRFDGSGGTTRLEANTLYAWYYETADYGRALSVILFEEPLSTYRAATTNAVHPSHFITGAPLLDTPCDSIVDTITTAWKRQGPTIFSMGEANGIPYSTTSTSFVNILDSTYTAYNANAPGFWAFPEKCGSYDSNNVPVEFFVHASDDNQTGVIEFRTNGSTLATINVNSGPGAYFTATANLDATQTEQKIDIICKAGAPGADPTPNLAIYFAACYSYQA